MNDVIALSAGLCIG